MVQPLRVAIVTPQMRTGGAEMLVVRLSHQLVRLGHTVKVISSGGELQARLPLHVQHVELPLQRKTFALSKANRLRLGDAIREFAPDVIHAQSPLTALATRLALLTNSRAARGRAPGIQPVLVTTIHGLRRSDYLLARWLLARASNAVVAVSAHTAAQLAGRQKDRVHIVPACVETQIQVEDKPPGHTGALGGPVPFVIGSVGRLEPEKGHAHLLEAFSLLATEYPHLHLHLVGDGVELPRLQALARDRGIVDRVVFFGYQSDVTACLQDFDLFALPSLREGMPLALLEAMSSGLPVVATRVGGVPEALGEAGILVKPGDDQALAAALRAMIDDPERRRSAAAASRARALSYSCEGMAQGYLAVYRETMASAKGEWGP
ncbi:MAG: glycosyltransferase [Symbiobacteriia bacterium]